jgi:hypothetical protein
MFVIGKLRRDYKRNDGIERERRNNAYFLTGSPHRTTEAARDRRAIEAELDELVEIITDRVLSVIAPLIATQCSLCQADEAQRQPPARPQPRPASHSTTIEAIIHCVRERGLGALEEPANIKRLLRCDATAKEQINRRIAAMKGVR